MAIDPVERIRAFVHETPLALDLPELLPLLAALPPSRLAPYLTVYLDWRPAGEEPDPIPPPPPKRSQRRAAKFRHRRDISWRPSRLEIKEQFEGLLERYGPRGTAFDSLKADIERIGTYLDEELDPAAHGVCIVACHHHRIFAPVPLDVPVRTGLAVGPIPSLRQLVHAVEDFPPYAVLVAEQHEALLWLFERETWARTVEFESRHYPHHQQQGGWSQNRFQRRADERVEHFAKAIAEETRRVFDERKQEVEYLIVAADEPMYSALREEFHESVARRIIGRIHLPIEANAKQVVAEAEPVVEQEERRKEMAAVQAVRDGVGAGGKGVAGAKETLTALETRQVQTLVQNDDFTMAGWADYTLPIFGVGEVPKDHPAGGDVANLVPTALEDEFVRLAIREDAGVELVRAAVPVSRQELEHVPDADDPKPRAEAARALDAIGGVGAVLQFALDAGRPTAEL
jgi:Bacterial archaeo-eukaryotic release factor family 10